MSGSDRIVNQPPKHNLFRLWPVAVMLVVSSVAMSVSAPASALVLPHRIDLRVLVIDDNSVWVHAIVAQMQVEGVPYTAVPPATANITDGFLASGDEAFYQAVVVPDATLPGLSAGEQSALRAYEAKFGIREVDAFNWANPAVGLNFAAITGDIAGTTATVTAAGLTAGFGYLNGPVPFSVGSYSYVAEPLAPAALPAGASYTTLVGEPLPNLATGSLIGVYSNAGVEQMVITAAFNFNQPQFKYLAHGIITWATRGVHFGYNRNNLTFNIDDAFAEDATWDTVKNCTPGEDCPGNLPPVSVRMSPDDVTYAVNWMQANQYQLTLAFNGAYAYVGNAADPLADSLRANAASFRWLNHGYEHIYQGCEQNFTVIPWVCTLDSQGPVWVPQATIYNEIHNNIVTGQALGLPFDATEYLSGEHSGLFLLPQQPLDNPNFAAALTQAGITAIGSDASRDNVSRQVGTATTIPRHPTALYYNTATQAQAVDEYNWFYTSAANGGSGACETSSTCITPLDPATGFTSYIVPTDAAFDMNFILGNDPRPFYAHTTNLTGDRLAYNLLDTILGTYRAAFTPATPLANLTLTQAATELQRQTQWAATGADAVTGYVRSGQITITNTTGVSVPFTAPAGTTVGGATLAPYGGEVSAWLAPGSKTGTLPATVAGITGNTLFLVGQSGAVTVSANGIPTPTVSVTGTLPAGLTSSMSSGVVTIAGTPAAGTAGSYPLTITTISAWGFQTQNLVLIVSIPPQLTSAASATAVTGVPFTFTVTTTGSPTPTLAIAGALPAGIAFSPATATLSGTASAATAGQQFPVTFTATNVGGVATQAFTLTVHSVPAFTSTTSAIAVAGAAFAFIVTTKGAPTPTLTMAGTLPNGITFDAATATLSGTASASTAGQQFPLTFTATNAAGASTQAFTLTVHSVPAFTSVASVIAVSNVAFSFTVTASGAPAPSIAMTGTLPTGITFNTKTATLSGTASTQQAGQQFPLTFTASNIHGPVTQQFTLSVTRIPQVTSNSSAAATAGVPFSFAVTSAGSPAASITQAGQLPAGITFAAGANGTATLSGTASSTDIGRSFPLKFTATNSAGASTQDFTLTVHSVPAFTSPTSATAVSGVPFTFTVGSVGSPTPALTRSGTLPAGITFSPHADGSATLAGTASKDQAGHNYPITLTATNPFGVTTQAFVLTVNADYTALVSLAPARLADTRPGETTIDGLFAGEGIRARGSTLELVVAGRGGVDSDAAAVALNVTVVDPTRSGFVTVYPCGAEQPLASNVNFTAGAVVPNAVIAKVGVGGKVCLYVSSDTHLVVDVNGYFPSASSYHPINPARVLDTRVGYSTIDGVQQGAGALTVGSITTVRITNRASVPADATAVVLNLTVTEAEGSGFVTAYPCGAALPTTSNINFTAGATIANLVVSRIGTDGSVCLFTSRGTHLVVDVNGYFPAGTSYESLVPARLLETRPEYTTIDGQFVGAGMRPAGSVTELTVTGRGGVPNGAATVVLNATVTDPTVPGFITVYPCGIDTPGTSNLNYGVDATVAITVIVQVGTDGKICLFNSSPAQLIVDVDGYLPG